MADDRRYNLPTAEEVAVVLPGDGSAGNGRDIILHNRMSAETPCNVSLTSIPRTLLFITCCFFREESTAGIPISTSTNPRKTTRDGSHKLGIMRFASLPGNGNANGVASCQKIRQRRCNGAWAVAPLHNGPFTVQVELYNKLVRKYYGREAEIDGLYKVWWRVIRLWRVIIITCARTTSLHSARFVQKIHSLWHHILLKSYIGTE
ncbi:hypothetical protein B0H10DRAFT_1961263 [Mycena sp. CBHHK59/15]|nr:hypothetical protein B0H10DRAFT_1961263 [Mycena sp. CBHHK59/15]